MNDRIFRGIYPTGISYADREREERGDYTKLAFLDYKTLKLSFTPACSQVQRFIITGDAANIQVRRGEFYQISTCGHGVILGE